MKRPLQKNPLLSAEVRPLTHKSPKPVPTTSKKKKDCDCPQGPPPTKAESDYIQNGLQLPQSKENLELLLRDIQQKGYLDKEYAYQLRQKEAVKGLTKRIEGQIDGEEMGGIRLERGWSMIPYWNRRWGFLRDILGERWRIIKVNGILSPSFCVVFLFNSLFLSQPLFCSYFSLWRINCLGIQSIYKIFF